MRKKNPVATDTSASDTDAELEPQILPSRQFVARLLANKENRKGFESLYENIVQSKDGVAFRVSRGGPENPGVYEFGFYPQWFLEWATKQANSVQRETWIAWVRQMMMERPGWAPDGFLETEEVRAYLDSMAADQAVIDQIAVVYLTQLPQKLVEALTELESEVDCFIRGWLMGATGSKWDFGMDQLAKQISDNKRRWIRDTLARVAEPEWEKARGYYDALLPQAKDIKVTYEGNKNRNWREMIRVGFPDFDEDMILMLSDKDEDEKLLSLAARTAKVNEDYSLPSNMALEQAARNCGMKPFKLGPRRIRELMNNGNSLKFATGKISLKQPRKVKRGEGRTSAKKLVSTKIH